MNTRTLATLFVCTLTDEIVGVEFPINYCQLGAYAARTAAVVTRARAALLTKER